MGACKRSPRHEHALASPQSTTCPACARTREGLPGGYVYLEGGYARTEAGPYINAGSHAVS